MAEESGDDSSKTEEPTSKKLGEARKKGQMISSREINHFFMMSALLIFLMVLAPRMGRDGVELLSPLISQPETYSFDEASLSHLFMHILTGGLMLMLLPALIGTIAAFGPAIVQGKWMMATENIAPKLSKLSPLAGFSKLYNIKGLIEFARNLLKIMIVSVAGFLTVWPYHNAVMGSLRTNHLQAIQLAGYLATRIMISTCIILFFISIADYVYQRFIFLKSMKMTRQELKDENKQSEGDPQMKQKVRQLGRERARKRMMANVPKANVVITNPTHFAIALQYDPDTMPAPKLLAKGTDNVAARIREIAEKNKIPIVRNPPLARALYDTAEIDEIIPVAHYQAVARVISYVYKIKGRTMARPKPVRGKIKK